MLISVITINYNDVAGLQKTMTSVLEQTYAHIEYIVIDGGSADGSKEYIESCQQNITYWVSEPDNGIYNAMNKGVDQATGEYLLFMNSGDSFHNLHVVEQFTAFKPVEDLVYGNSLFIFKNKESYLKIMPSKLGGMTIFYRTLNHQSIFHNKRVFEAGNRYSEDYKMLADWVFYNEVILFKNGSYRHIELVVANYDAHGFSSEPENKVIMQKERDTFYSTHIDFFIPYLITNYEDLKRKQENNKLKQDNRFLKALTLLKRSIRMVLKGY